MKMIALFVMILCSYQLQAACKCNCDQLSGTMCAASYDLERPCNGMCSGQPGRTACPTVQIFNQSKNQYEWITLCTE